MKAIILAGGYATRLWPVTKDHPKPLLPLGEKRIIDHVYDKIRELSGVKEVILSTNKKFEEEFREWIESRGVSVELFIEETFEEKQKLGAIKALSLLVESVYSREFLIIAGDNVFTFSLREAYERYLEVNKGLIVLFNVGSKELAKRYATIALSREGKILRLIEKPERPETTLISTGIYFMPRSYLEEISEYLSTGYSGDAPGYFFSWLSKRRELYGFNARGEWFDVGSLDSYLEAMKKFIRNKVSKKARLKNVELKPPIVVERGVEAYSSTIGPYAFVGEETSINDSEISLATLLGEAKVNSSRIFNSLIGRTCLIEGVTLTNSLLGDHCRVKGFS